MRFFEKILKIFIPQKLPDASLQHYLWKLHMYVFCHQLCRSNSHFPSRHHSYGDRRRYLCIHPKSIRAHFRTYHKGRSRQLSFGLQDVFCFSCFKSFARDSCKIIVQYKVYVSFIKITDGKICIICTFYKHFVCAKFNFRKILYKGSTALVIIFVVAAISLVLLNRSSLFYKRSCSRLQLFELYCYNDLI